MMQEKSVGAVIYKEEPFGSAQGKEGKRFYLLLYYPTKHWNFPKGKVEKGETEMETAKREIQEETSLVNLEFIDGFREINKYFMGKEGQPVFKTVVFFLAKSGPEEVKISFEHRGFVWLPYEKAIKRIYFKNAKNILEKANDFVLKNSG